MRAPILLGLAIALALPPAAADAQTRKPTAQEVSAIRNCAAQHQDNVDEGERQCVFNLVAEPCTKKPEAASALADSPPAIFQRTQGRQRRQRVGAKRGPTSSAPCPHYRRPRGLRCAQPTLRSSQPALAEAAVIFQHRIAQNLRAGGALLEAR